ncbi:carbohydrate ABC transporter permease [Ornithinibacillus bavariensis]|uniref:Sugar ABC transporter permease n=1 Tax=Ornithinibacillus bavariensis TaxID=545502 RepID=A0A919X8R9_9BACI|nr:sugar ABC transporter permease [Ornithinibacillus bavariensis]GIO26497.1 sugar ABC transporter permease [Ornithinibacillus bavariensis]
MEISGAFKNAGKNLKRTGKQIRKNYAAYLFLLPKLILFTLFIAIPVVWAFVLSFQEYRITESNIFAGLDNYKQVLESEAFREALLNTTIYTVVTVPFNVITALIAASLIHSLGRFAQNFFRAAFYLPTVTSMVIIAMVWRWMYNYEFGLFNYVIGWFGMEPINWLGQTNSALMAIIIMQMLIPFGVGIILYLASMSSISESLYEAATIDGANAFQKWVRITIPMLTPSTVYLTLLSTIGSFQVFTQIILMTGGGPGYATETLVHLIYKTGFRDFEFGLAAAQSVVLFLIILVISVFQYRVLNRRN